MARGLLRPRGGFDDRPGETHPHGRHAVHTWRFIEPLAARLRRRYPDKQVVFQDERFTSVLAHRAMLESGIGRMARRDKALVDKISATIILQSYMEFEK